MTKIAGINQEGPVIFMMTNGQQVSISCLTERNGCDPFSSNLFLERTCIFSNFFKALSPMDDQEADTVEQHIKFLATYSTRFA